MSTNNDGQTLTILNTQKINVFTGDGGVKFIPVHYILHRNNFVINNRYLIIADAIHGTVTAEICGENDYQGYDIECVSHHTLIDVNDNLRNISINTDGNVTFLSPATGSLCNYFSKYYFLASDKRVKHLSIVTQRLQQ